MTNSFFTRNKFVFPWIVIKKLMDDVFIEQLLQTNPPKKTTENTRFFSFIRARFLVTLLLFIRESVKFKP